MQTTGLRQRERRVEREFVAWARSGARVMARFQCAACSGNGECDYQPHRHKCPLCGSADVVFALSIDELPGELVATLLRAEPLDDDDDDDDDED